MRDTSRRGFLKSVGVAAVAGPTVTSATASAQEPRPNGRRRTSFSPASSLKKLSENLYLLEDTCNVYLVRDGSRGLLIDFGSGKILDYLSGLGVTKVDWILHTHHHRDQCQGDYLAGARSIPIVVPAHERHLFADAENFWRNRRVFHLYYMRNDFNTITENIPVASVLSDYGTFRWNNRDIFVLPTPGHTLGSVTLLVDIDGKRVAFSGDLMHSPGKIVNLWDTQINYGGAEGVDLGIFSLTRLREQKPALLCPSHGDPLPDPDKGIESTIDRLVEYYRFQTGNTPSVSFRGYAVSPHLIAHHLTTSSFYAILSKSGKAMFIDYGSASGLHFGNFERATAVTDRIRFVEHNVDDLKTRFGMQSVDVAMPSHMHDDHLNGFPHLIRHYGTKIWCYENMLDVLENPRGYNLGCILGEPFKVSRTFHHGEHFKWEEYDFEVSHSPGHTEYQMALFVTIDGARVVFSGDAFFPYSDSGPGVLRHNLIFRNHVESDSHINSIRNLIEHEPNLMAPGHGRPFLVNREDLLSTEQKMRRQEQLFREVIADPDVNFGLDPSWCSIYPYQMLMKPGDSTEAEIRVRNYRSAPMKLDIGLVAPGEWHIEPDTLHVEVAAQAAAKAAFKIQIPRDWQAGTPRLALAADVVCDGKYLGQITEAVVDIGTGT
ncbi:MAG TPA: MBL fold metallo-hydrolase [Acidobacteriota bacterium]|nr:MBL fold metallo-hydrolase [Acidobacteriota bacterium]